MVSRLAVRPFVRIKKSIDELDCECRRCMSSQILSTFENPAPRSSRCEYASTPLSMTVIPTPSVKESSTSRFPIFQSERISNREIEDQVVPSPGLATDVEAVTPLLSVRQVREANWSGNVQADHKKLDIHP